MWLVFIYDMQNYNDCNNAESICTLWHCHHTKIANHSGILTYIYTGLTYSTGYFWIPSTLFSVATKLN